MKRLFMGLVIAGLALIVSGCGTLNQKISNTRMSKENIKFAETMPHWPNYANMEMEVEDITYDTDKSASYVMPTFPFLYWSTIGSFENDTFFVNRKVQTIVPVFYLIRENVFNKQGSREMSDVTFNLACVYWINVVDSQKKSYWRNGLVWLPGVGPCIGFGSDFFQFLWIPFSDMM